MCQYDGLGWVCKLVGWVVAMSISVKAILQLIIRDTMLRCSVGSKLAVCQLADVNITYNIGHYIYTGAVQPMSPCSGRRRGGPAADCR